MPLVRPAPATRPPDRTAARPAPRWRAAATLTAVVLLAGCRANIPPFGTARADAVTNAGDFFNAAALRFTNVQRDRKFAAARPKLAKYALTPSKIVRDTSVWTGGTPTDRVLSLSAGHAGSGYAFAANPNAPAPERTGDSRHVMRLRQLADDDQFVWTTSVDMAIGHVTAAQAATTLTSLFAVAEGRAGAELHADSRAAFPRAAAALGRLITVDSVGSRPDASGATTVELALSLHADRLRRSYPAFADYVDKYVAPARYTVAVTDARGATYFTSRAAKNRVSVRARVRDGHLVALAGEPTPLPDQLVLRTDLAAKFGPFTVGANELLAEMTVVRSAHERGWLLRFNREPKWRLPLAAATFLRAPLRRPFAGEGATIRVTVRDTPGAQTLVTRQTETAVQESAILRFLNALGSSAMNDFAGKAEAEENRFWVDAFTALRADALALSGSLPAS